jgi:superfamily II helicase
MCCLGHSTAEGNPLQHYLMDERHSTRIAGARLDAIFAARVGASHIRALSNGVRSSLRRLAEIAEEEDERKSHFHAERQDQLDDPEIQIVRCRYCGFKSRATLASMRSHRNFICGDCGEELCLDNNNRRVRKALDSFANALNDLRRRLADMRSRLNLVGEPSRHKPLHSGISRPRTPDVIHP